jgi:DNA-binding CsgD family transcriptional regulator
MPIFIGRGLCAGFRRVSVTTVHTHRRRTREKTGWKSVAELTRRFHELNAALRAN